MIARSDEDAAAPVEDPRAHAGSALESARPCSVAPGHCGCGLPLPLNVSPEEKPRRALRRRGRRLVVGEAGVSED